MEKQGIISYALVFLAIATLAVSVFGAAYVMDANGTLSKATGIAGVSAVPAAEPTVETAKIRLFVPATEVPR